MDSLVEKVFRTGGDSIVGIAYDLYYPAVESKVRVDFGASKKVGVGAKLQKGRLERYVKQGLNYEE